MSQRITPLILSVSCVLTGWQLAAADDKKPSRPKTKARAKGVRFDPVIRKIEGWTVHVDPALIEGKHQKEGARALRMLADHLNRISILMPADRLKRLRKLEIWIERRHPRLGAMQYHPSAGWLYVLNRISNSVAVIDTGKAKVVSEIAMFFVKVKPWAEPLLV